MRPHIWKMNFLIGILIACFYTLQVHPNPRWAQVLNPSLMDQWNGIYWGVFLNFLHFQGSWAWMALFSWFILNFLAERMWDTKSWLAQFLAVQILSFQLISQSQFQFSIGINAWLAYIWLAILSKSPSKMNIAPYIKFILLSCAFLLFTESSEYLNQMHGSTSMESISLYMGASLGFTLFLIGRVLGWIARLFKIKNLIYLPILGISAGLGNWYFQVIQPTGQSLEEWTIWQLDQGNRDSQILQKISLMNQNPLWQTELAERCITGLKFPCSKAEAIKMIQKDTTEDKKLWVLMGYYPPLPADHKTVLQILEKNKSSIKNDFIKAQIYCGSRDSNLLNPQKGLNLLESHLALANFEAIAGVYSTCLARLGRWEEARNWAYRAYQDEQKLTSESWSHRLNAKVNLDSYFRIRAKQLVFYPESYYLESVINLKP